MQGGQVYALRDDLNQTVPNSYSSHPYALLEYSDSDGRPGMTVFQVLRENGDDTFEYSITAGTILQAPMPLPLMPLPFGPRFVGAPPRSLNTEITNWQLAALATQETPLYSAIQIETAQPHAFRDFDKLALQLNPSTTVSTEWFYATSSIPNLRIVRGVISTTAPAALDGAVRVEEQPTDLSRWRYRIPDVTGFEVGKAAVIRNDAVGAHWLGIITETNSMSAGGYYVEINFTRNRTAEIETATSLAYSLLAGATPNRYDGWRISYGAAPPGITDTGVRDLYQRFTVQDRKGNLWVYRGPHSPMDSPGFVSRFYYKTLPGFYFPSQPFQNQPAVGTITPYLRQWDAAQGIYLGNPVNGDLNNDGLEDGNALTIRYSPVWPDNVPVLHMAETLTLPKRGLPAVRGQRSLEVLYQQSQSVANNLNGDLTARSVVLHDPTREKEFQFAMLNDPILLDRIPDSVKTNAYRGHGFFPNLPPHLVERFFVDPNRGGFGALVFKGQFFDAPLGDDYLLLNVLTRSDKEGLKALCLDSDERKNRWDSAMEGLLRTTMQLFVENPAKPGTYIPSQPRVINPEELAEVSRDDVAVDSYALTAVGPKTGYITLIAGNGLAFTPVEEPVSIHIVKVTDALYRGELKVVQSSNPLNEKLTLQQVVDLAGKGTNDYEFEWLITAPVDGAPPPVYENVRASLLQDGSWTHIHHPLDSDSIAAVRNTPTARQGTDINGGVVAITAIPFQTVQADSDRLVFVLRTNQTHTLTSNNEVVVRDRNGNNYPAIVTQVAVTTFSGNPATRLTLQSASSTAFPASADVLELFESVLPARAQSIAHRQFTVPAGRLYTQYYLSMDLDTALGARVYLDGVLVASANLGIGDTPTTAAPNGFSALPLVYQLGSDQLNGGQNLGAEIAHSVAVEFFSSALPGAAQLFNLRLEAYEAVDRTDQPGSPWLALDAQRFPEGVRAVLGESADVRSLSDNYLIMRYRAGDPSHASYKPDLNGEKQGWSLWTEPQLAEGWIKRVLAGINPFNQRITDLFNNRVNTDVSLLTQAGQRWEGDIALNLDAINNFGLIEIYETVLRRGKDLSINSGINFGPANDALLLAAGYLNDLYMMLGNEAWADAANPTIGIGTKDRTYGEIATALFAFKGQVPSLLEEELALLRGRDDFLQPGVETRPVYNRMIWNYTRGIDAGEVIYALNYNIQENNESGVDGVINADDARKMFPQGHGDAYGHYLTALKGYYELFLDGDFDWVPRTEAVTVLGKAVQVDYQDERKFAGAAAALARSGRQIFDLTWRKDYMPGDDAGWEHLAGSRENTRRFVPSTRFWGADHWASRTVQGAYYNWAIGNALLPEVDPDPSHEGIQKVDRTTVPELKELPSVAQELQSTLDNADAHLTPLGLPAGGLAFDISPTRVTGVESETHFEQVYSRSKVALQNALAAFDDAKDVTRLLRSEQDSLAEFQSAIGRQELAYTNALIELYGTPYPDDVGPGRTFKQNYAGPDLIHYMYVDNVDLRIPALSVDASAERTYKLDTQNPPSDWVNYVSALNQNSDYLENRDYITFTLNSHGFYSRPSEWTGRRPSPGKVQDAVSAVILAHNAAASALESHKDKKYILDRRLDLFKVRMDTHDEVEGAIRDKAIAQTAIANAEFFFQMISRATDLFSDAVVDAAKQIAGCHSRRPDLRPGQRWRYFFCCQSTDRGVCCRLESCRAARDSCQGICSRRLQGQQRGCDPVQGSTSDSTVAPRNRRSSRCL